MKIKTLLVTTTSIVAVGFFPSVSTAAGGTYLELGVGAVELMDSDITGSGINTDAEFDTGHALRAAVGHGDDSGWRAEVEFGYRDNDVETIGSTSGVGEASVLSGMINGYRDFDLGNGWAPYLGLGVGAVRVEADGYSPVSNSSINDHDTVFGYQGIVGVAWSLSDSVALTADYRYLATDDLSLTTASGSNVDAEYRSHAVMLGLRYSFGGGTADASAMAVDQPEPAMELSGGQGSGDGFMEASGETGAESTMNSDAAAKNITETVTKEASAEPETEIAAVEPASDLAHAYRVLFAFDSAALSGPATEALRDITGQVLRGNVVRIEATGHADASGTRAYNMELSKHRAEAVKSTLIDMGVDANMISITWRGEEELLVPTPDGVREQQNRRVEIVIPE